MNAGQLRSRFLYLLFFPPVVGFAITTVAGWPGAISPDAFASIEEGVNFSFFGHQEPFYGFVWAMAISLMPVTTAVKCFFVVQVLSYWLAFALFVHSSLRQRSPWLALAAALAGFLPPLLDFAVMVQSNMQSAIAWLLALAVCDAFPRKRSFFITIPLMFYGFVARSGMIVVVAPVIFACLIARRSGLNPPKAALLAVSSTMAFFLLSQVVTLVLLGNPSRDRVLSVSQLFDISGVYQETRTHCVPPSLVPNTTTAEAIMSEYDPTLVSSIIWANSKGGFILPESTTDFASLRRCWMETIRLHPTAYFRVKERFALKFLMIGMDWAPATDPDYSANARLGLAVPHNPILDAIRRYVDNSRRMLLWKGWCWIACGALLTIVAMIFRLSMRYAVVALYLAALCSLVPHFLLGQAVLARYFFLPYMLCVASFLLFGNSLVETLRGRHKETTAVV